MYIGSLVESMYYDHEIIFNEDKEQDEQLGWKQTYWDTAKKHAESKGASLHHDPSNTGDLLQVWYGKDLNKIDPTQLNRELASSFHEYEKKQVPSNVIQKVIHKLRMLYNKWLHKANAEKAEGNIGFFKNILRILANWIDNFLTLLSGRKTRVDADYYKQTMKFSNDIKNTKGWLEIKS